MNTSARLPRIRTARAVENFKLVIAFENGEQRLFDVLPLMTKGVFQSLNNRLTFERVVAHPSFVEWPGEIDLSADTLYLKSAPISPLQPN